MLTVCIWKWGLKSSLCTKRDSIRESQLFICEHYQLGAASGLGLWACVHFSSQHWDPVRTSPGQDFKGKVPWVLVNETKQLDEERRLWKNNFIPDGYRQEGQSAAGISPNLGLCLGKQNWRMRRRVQRPTVVLTSKCGLATSPPIMPGFSVFASESQSF